MELPEKYEEVYGSLQGKINQLIDYLKEREEMPDPIIGADVSENGVCTVRGHYKGDVLHITDIKQTPPPVTTIEEMKEKFLISADLKGKIGENMLNEIITAAQDQRTAEIKKELWTNLEMMKGVENVISVFENEEVYKKRNDKVITTNQVLTKAQALLTSLGNKSV